MLRLCVEIHAFNNESLRTSLAIDEERAPITGDPSTPLALRSGFRQRSPASLTPAYR